MTVRSLIALAAPAIVAAGMASATTFDFADLADRTKRDHGGREQMFTDVFSDGWSVEGITVRTSANAHLDGAYGRGALRSPASGLGACNAPSGDCNESDWDGVRDAGEVLKITFDTIVDVVWTIRETTDMWRNRQGVDHTLSSGCARVNGQDRAISNGVLGSIGPSAEYSFEPCVTQDQGISDFYVSSAELGTPAPVPVPAGAVLLGTALLGLGLRARRRG